MGLGPTTICFRCALAIFRQLRSDGHCKQLSPPRNKSGSPKKTEVLGFANPAAKSDIAFVPIEQMNRGRWGYWGTLPLHTEISLLMFFC